MQTENADAYVLLCSSLVFLMVPGVSLFYSGMLRVKNALHIIQICMLSYATVAIQWTLFGFSLSSGASNNPFIGGKLAYLGLGFDFASAMENGKLSLITYTIYQLQFAAVTSAIIFGGIVERCRVLPTMLFTFVWTTIVYDPIAYWTWNSTGWLHKLGFLDFSGGSQFQHRCSCAYGVWICSTSLCFDHWWKNRLRKRSNKSTQPY
jgi:Amt family ammonium transporter